MLEERVAYYLANNEADIETLALIVQVFTASRIGSRDFQKMLEITIL